MTVTAPSPGTGPVPAAEDGQCEDRAARLLAELVEVVRTHPGMLGKSTIGLVSEVFGASDWLAGPGDDGAVVDAGGTQVVACGEAMWPPFVRADPAGAGFAAVLTNVNDLAAMGARPLGIVDTVIGSEELAREVLQGIKRACELYRIPLLGGHLTRHDGEPSVSAFGVGVARRPLSVTRIEPGQTLLVAAALEGRMRPDFPFFPAFEQRGERCAGDLRVLAEVADSGAAVAAKDISMAGLVGSLAMLLECGPFGVTLDLDAIPRPDGVAWAEWLTCFPSFGFLLTTPPDRAQECAEAFRRRGLAAAAVGRIDDSGRLDLCLGRAEGRDPATITALDLRTTAVTGLTRAAR
ncbi:MAG TPA: AIR synthase related protein [Pseudonocardia sp.]|jgi:selenophosphate synthetase-related protein|nr:AIR synthase related protein [Pseudonocardia sp.]